MTDINDILFLMQLSHLYQNLTCPKGRKNTLQSRVDSGKIGLADAADEYEELTKKEKALHETFVRQAHVRHDGSPRIIKHAALAVLRKNK